jgi:hypothetical protein
MTEGSSSIKTVYVYTWPYQWVYEPVYWVLAGLQKAEQWKFEFVTGPGNGKVFDSDEAIQDAFLRSTQPLKIALCEPPAERGYRLVPFLWRLPVWGFVPKNWWDLLGLGENPRDPTLMGKILTHNKLVVYRFPDSATTGRYAKAYLDVHSRIFHINEINQENRIQCYEELDLAEFMDISRRGNDEKLPLAFSFTPLHVIDGDVMRVCEIAGIAGRVTAVVLPLKKDGDDQIMALRDRLLLGIKNFISVLYAETDFGQSLPLLVARHAEDVQRLSGLGGRPTWCQENSAVDRLLAIYVTRGCFFPYCVLDSSLQLDLFKIFRDTLNNHAERMQEWFHGQFAALVSPGLVWTDLTAGRRHSILTTPVSTRGLGDSGSLTTLASKLLHLAKSNAEQEFRDLFIEDPKETYVPLHYVRFAGNDNNTNTVMVCSTPGQCGLFPSKVELPCLACRILGGQATLMLQVDRYLRHKLSDKVSLVSWSSRHRSQDWSRGGFRWSVVAFEDLQRLCRIFVETLDLDDQSGIRPQVGANLYRLDGEEVPCMSAKQVVFSIQTAYQQKSNSGPASNGGNAKARLREWKVECQDMAIDSWLFYPKGWNGKAEPQWFHITKDASIDEEPPWAQRLVGAAHFYDWCHFAYVAVVGIPTPDASRAKEPEK